MRFRHKIKALTVIACTLIIGCGAWGNVDVADFTFSIANPWPFEEVQFTDASSSCCSVIVSWTWTFEDAIPPVWDGPIPPPVVFLSEGPHQVTLEIKNKEGFTSSVTKIVEVGNIAANDPPIAHDATAMTTGAIPVDITLTGTDPEGMPILFFIDTEPAVGTLDSSGIPLVTYSPPAAGGFWGVASFTFYVHDGVFPSNIATVYVGVDDNAPTAVDDFIQLDQDTSAPVVLVGFDPDLDPIEFIIENAPSHGKLTGVPPNLTYTPDAGYAGIDSFTFYVTDHVLDSAPATVDIQVLSSSGNNPPVAFDINEITFMDVPVDIFLNASDAVEDPLTYWIFSLPANGTLLGASTPPYEIPGNMVTYQPNIAYIGVDSFTYKAWDGQKYSNEATVTIDVGP